ncbi:MAG: hypothetical protein CMJ31_05710 [Phycisphaerae bacterium]|nr:hypothetical protein [Phycisphaerae bacterium]
MNDESRRVRVVCFDWGGVILRICRSFEEGVAAAGLELRDGYDAADLYDVRRKLSHDYQIGAIEDADFFTRVSDSLRGLYSADEIAAIHDAWLVGEYKGVGDIMDELNASPSVKTAMLSNTNARHWSRREHDFPTCGKAELPHASHLLGLAKPDPAIYAAFTKAVAVDSDQILFFDDLAENIEAARTAGWQAVHIDHTTETADQIRLGLKNRGIAISPR